MSQPDTLDAPGGVDEVPWLLRRGQLPIRGFGPG